MEQPELLASGDGTSIALWRWGSGPPLVALHAVTVDHTCWDGMRPALEGRRTVVAVDRRGHGASDVGPEPHSLRQEVDDPLAGQAHLATHTAPELLAAEILAFL